MEQEKKEGVVDLSNALNEGGYDIEETENKEEREDVGGLYGIMIKLSGGLIKTAKQAQAVAVLIIIIANLITFYLLFQNNSANNAPATVPAATESGAVTK